MFNLVAHVHIWKKHQALFIEASFPIRVKQIKLFILLF